MAALPKQSTEPLRFTFSFTPTITPRGDGTFMVAAGRPVLQGMLTVAEVSKKLRITERHLRDLIDEGAITAVNVAGSNRKLWRIPLEELERFLNQRSSLKP